MHVRPRVVENHENKKYRAQNKNNNSKNALDAVCIVRIILFVKKKVLA